MHRSSQFRTTISRTRLNCQKRSMKQTLGLTFLWQLRAWLSRRVCNALRRPALYHTCLLILFCHVNTYLLPCPHPFVDFLNDFSANCHILGCRDPRVRPMTPKFELGRDFCTMHLTAKFHHPTFNRLEVTLWTNKQTNRCRWKHPPHCAMLRWWVTISKGSVLAQSNAIWINSAKEDWWNHNVHVCVWAVETCVDVMSAAAMSRMRSHVNESCSAPNLRTSCWTVSTTSSVTTLVLLITNACIYTTVSNQPPDTHPCSILTSVSQCNMYIAAYKLATESLKGATILLPITSANANCFQNSFTIIRLCSEFFKIQSH